ncbi:MAG: PQQ-binding-like beta-propeller repeat protein [Muribaculaceae bacterium]|nr:PQQ-binding-like beta-propeller repeat protein [Muribaculaceae bacterium]
MKKIFLAAAAILGSLLGVDAQHIAVLSDVHVTPGNANEQALREAVREINAGGFDFVVMNGDLSNEGSDVELANVKSILDSISAPLYVLPGNHESTWSQSAAHTFPRLWGMDRFVDTIGDSLVIVGIASGPYMKMGDGHIKQEDLHWLRKTLEERVKPGMKVLSFNHYPLLDDLDNYTEYIEVLQDYPVIGHICGHYHQWRHYTAGGKDSGSDIEGAIFRALDMRNGNYGYAVVDISPDWVAVYEKVLGQPREPKYAMPVRTKHTRVNPREKMPVVAPEGYEVARVWADSASVFTRLGIDGKNVYFGTSTGHARAVDKRTGELVWDVPTEASLYSRPVVLPGGRLVAVPADGGILMLRASDGHLQRELPSKEGPYVADGAITPDGKTYLQGGYKRFEARRPSDGKLLWSYDSIFNYCQAAPAVDGDDVVFGAWDTNLRCVDRRTGKLKWVWNNGKSANMLGPGNVVPVITPERVYIVAPDRYMTAIDRRTGATLWRDNSHRYREALGHSEDFARIYAKTMDGELVAVDATSPDFRELWTVDMGLGYEHAPCVVVEKDGVVYAGSRRGHVVMVDPASQKVLADLPLGVSEVNGIDIDPTTGDVYVSLIEGSVWKISPRK